VFLNTFITNVWIHLSPKWRIGQQINKFWIFRRDVLGDKWIIIKKYLSFTWVLSSRSSLFCLFLKWSSLKLCASNMLPLVANMAEMCEAACLRVPRRTLCSRVHSHTYLRRGAAGSPAVRKATPLCGFCLPHPRCPVWRYVRTRPHLVNMGCTLAPACPTRPPPRHACRDSAHHAEAAAKYLCHRHP